MPTLVALLVLSARVIDDERGFSFEPPAGYDSKTPTQPSMLQVFMRGTAGTPDFEAFTVVEMAGTLPPHAKLLHDVVERSAREAADRNGATITRISYGNARWKGFVLDTFVVQLHANDAEIVTLAVQLPLKRRALQVQAIANAANKAGLEVELQKLLDSFEGESNWVSEDEADRRLSERVGMIAGFLVVGLGALIGALIVRRRRAKA